MDLIQKFCLIIAFGSCAVFGQNQNHSNEFRPDYRYYAEANGWLKFHKAPATWSEARLKCYYEGSVLASPINNELYSIMKSQMLTETRSAFIGTQTLTATGDYFSVEGVRIENMPIQWAKGQPDNLNDEERCLEMQKDGAIADIKCSDVLPYMCYKRRTGNATITECGTSDTGYERDQRTGSCYKFHPDCVTWWRAHMVCSSEGGYLVVVNSEVEANLLHEKYATRPIRCNELRFIHVGFHNPYADRAHWFTVDGKRLHEAGYERWSQNEPNNEAGIENCGSLTRDNTGFNDWKCDESLPFVCEIPPPEIQAQ